MVESDKEILEEIVKNNHVNMTYFCNDVKITKLILTPELHEKMSDKQRALFGYLQRIAEIDSEYVDVIFWAAQELRKSEEKGVLDNE